MSLDSRKIQYKNFPLVLIILLTYAKILADVLYDGQRYFADPDDMLRFFQIRDLFSDHQWFDMQLPFISMPEAYVSPWSRLVDLPYLAFSALFSFFASDEKSLLWATWVVPPLLFLAFAWMLVAVVKDSVGRVPTLAESLAMTIFLGLIVYEFSPGRIDHHNFQLLACLMLAKGLADSNPRSAALWLGIGTVFSVCVGLELVPIISMTFAFVGCCAAMNDHRSLAMLQYSGAIIALATPTAAILFLGVDNSLAAHCDAFSWVWINALIGASALLLIIPLIWKRVGNNRTATSQFVIRLSLAVPIIGLFGLLLSLVFPACTNGVYHMIDDVSRAFWLNDINQEKSGAFLFTRQYFLAHGLFVAASLLIAGVIAVNASHLQSSSARALLGISALTVFAVIMTLIQERNARFPIVFAVLLLPGLFEILGISKRKGSNKVSFNNYGSVMVALIVFLLAAVSSLLTEGTKKKNIAAFVMAYAKCEGEDMSALANLNPSRILAPFGLAYKLVHMNRGHQVLALEFHRASPGIRRVALAFTSEDLSERNWALKPADYVVVCGNQDAGDFEGARLYRRLVEGTPTAGFELVENIVQSRILIYKISHEKLEI